MNFFTFCTLDFIGHSTGIVLRVLNKKRSQRSVAAQHIAGRLTTMQRDKQLKQLKRVKQRANQQHYSHAHHWSPQQQYKSKSWTIAIILKLTFVA